MRHKTTFAFVLMASLAAVSPTIAEAQDQRVHFSFGGGFTAPNSEVRDRLGDGYRLDLAGANPAVPHHLFLDPAAFLGAVALSRR